MGYKERYEFINKISSNSSDNDEEINKNANKIIYKTVSLGSVMSCIISWSINQSFWWMFFHGILGWFYIIYWSIFQ